MNENAVDELVFDPLLHSIDWGRARSTPEVHVAIALMMAANEFYTQQFFGTLLKDNSEDERALLLDLVQDAAWGQLVRYQAALLNEIRVTFIDELKRPDSRRRKALIDSFHKRHPKVGAIYERMELLLTGKEARALLTVRNHISFHFSYAKNAQAIADGFEGKMDELVKDDQPLSWPLVQAGARPGETRYVFAEGVTNKIWRTLWGIQKSFKSREEADKDERLVEMGKYLQLAANTVIEYSSAFIETWADEYKLFTTTEKYSAVKDRDERAVGPYSY